MNNKAFCHTYSKKFCFSFSVFRYYFLMYDINIHCLLSRNRCYLAGVPHVRREELEQEQDGRWGTPSTLRGKYTLTQGYKNSSPLLVQSASSLVPSSRCAPPY